MQLNQRGSHCDVTPQQGTEGPGQRGSGADREKGREGVGQRGSGAERRVTSAAILLSLLWKTAAEIQENGQSQKSGAVCSKHNFLNDNDK